MDPPFNSNRNYNLIYNGDANAQQKAFHDMWTLTDKNEQLILQFDSIIDGYDAPSIVKDFLKAWLAPLKERGKADKQLLIYLMYMTERLILMHKLLKDTGSIYYHCDPSASHYVKIIMDGIFGRKNFRREVIWNLQTASGHKSQVKGWIRGHDVILYYTKSKNFYFEKQYELYKEEYIKRFKKIDESGRHYRDDRPSKKRQYLDESSGTGYTDVWNNIMSFQQNSSSTEYLGYQTQKPIALLDRIIKASCPPSGLVLDPFCGCGTTIASAIKNNVNWIGMDISWDAVQVMKKRINNLSFSNNIDYVFTDCNPQTREEYEKLDAYQKQDWLIRKVKGMPNERKSGDGGVDGEVAVCLGLDEEDKYKWGKMVFSVKTGKQKAPELIRELMGTMQKTGAVFGGLILDVDPTAGMIETANGYGTIECTFNKNFPSRQYNKVQIITSQDIFDGMCFGIPYTLAEMKTNAGDQSSFADILFNKA